MTDAPPTSSPAAASAPAPLEYEAEFREERLPSGSLRVTVVVDRARGVNMALMIMGVGVASTVGLGVLWYYTGSMKAGIYALMLGPMTAVIGICLIAIQMNAPRSYTHVAEVSRNELIIKTTIAGDPVTRRHLNAEIISIIAQDSGLEIQTTRDNYVCMMFAKPQHLKVLGQRIREELGRV